MAIKSEVQGVALAVFGAFAGGYLAELTARAEANGVATLTSELLPLQQPLLGVSLSDDSVWVDVFLGNLGVTSTNAAYAQAAAWANGQLAAGVSRAAVVVEAVQYLLGDSVEAVYASVAEAFAAKVEEGVEWSEGDGATELAIGALRVQAGNPETGTGFNLTAALAELKAAQAAVAAFLEAWGEENDVEDAEAGDVELVLDGIEADLGIAGLTAAQKSAAIATEQANLDKDLADANKDLTAATKEVNKTTGLKLAIDRFATAFKAAQDADVAAAAAQLALDEAAAAANVVLTGLTLNAVNTYVTAPAADGTIKIDVKAADLVGPNVTLAQANTAIASINNYVSKFNADVAADKAFDTALAVAQTRLDTLVDLEANPGDIVDNLVVTIVDSVADHLTLGSPAELYAAALADVAAAQKALAEFAELLADYSAAKADVDALTALTKVVDALIESINENGFFVNVAEDGDFFNTLDETEADVFLLSGLKGGEGVEIANFGLLDKDLLVFGDTVFQLVKLEKAINKDVGSATAFEIFWEEADGSLFLYVETKAFGGNLLNLDEVYTVELIGFSAAEIGSFTGNLLSA